MTGIAKWIRHNQGVAMSLLIMSLLIIWTYGCESKVTSLTEDGKMVSRTELDLEVAAAAGSLEGNLDLLTRRAELKYSKLARDDAIKTKLMNFAALSAEVGTVNPSGVVSLLFSILGVGAVIDNRIKDKVIKNRPLPA